MFTPRFLAILTGALLFTACTACSPTLPPTTVPEPPNPALAPLKDALQAYVDQTQPFRKEAALAAERVPGKADAAPAARALGGDWATLIEVLRHAADYWKARGTPFVVFVDDAAELPLWI